MATGHGEQRMIHGLTIGQAARKIRLVFRAAVELLERSRMASAVLAGVRATTRSFGRVLHQLWLEVTGFMFLAIAAIGAMAGIREYGKYQSGHAAGPGRLALAACFTVSFAWFGVSSFWRVRRKAKSYEPRATSLKTPRSPRSV
jgi:hypothetical protein